MSTPTAAAAKRLEKTTACLPVVYGSVAFYLGKKADEYQTHQWTLYVRGPNNEDLSGVISKVVFQLHASFAQPVRELESPPFEVTERGWGEFEAQMRIIWKDTTEKATLVRHGDLPCQIQPNDADAFLSSFFSLSISLLAYSWNQIVSCC